MWLGYIPAAAYYREEVMLLTLLSSRAALPNMLRGSQSVVSDQVSDFLFSAEGATREVTNRYAVLIPQ